MAVTPSDHEPKRPHGAAHAGFSLDPTTDTGLVVAYAIGAKGATPATLAAALKAEIAKLAKGPIPPAELAKVKLQMVTHELEERETPIGKAMALGEAVMYRGDPAYANRDIEELQAVTAADVQRVLRKYVLDGKHVTIEYVQEPKAKAPGKGASKAPAASVVKP
jgi:zinc protease